MKYKLFIFVAFTGILLSACGIFSTSDNPLEGTSWELFAISKHRPIQGTTITISFEDGRASGSAGCNSYGSSYVVNRGKIEFGMFESTLMACEDPAVSEQETYFMQLLGEAQRYELADGRLLIYRSDHEALTFVPPK